jgi:hypothetical protein
MLQLRKFVMGPWEAVRNGLWLDLQTIEDTLNLRFANIFTGNTIKPGSLPVVDAAHGGTGFSSYTKGDLLAGNASGTLSKQAVGANGQVLTADSTSPDGVSWQSAASAIPRVLNVNTSYLGAFNYLTEESIEIAAGVIMEIGDSAVFAIEGAENDSELFYVDVGTQNPVKMTWTLNLSTVGTLDWFAVNNANTPGPGYNISGHGKRKGGAMLPTFRWTNDTISTFSNTMSVSADATDDIQGGGLSANATAASVGANKDGLGWQFQVPVSMKRKVLYALLGSFNEDTDVTLSFSNSTIPSKTITIVASCGTVTDSQTLLVVTFWGAPCIMTVSANSKNKNSTTPAPSVSFAYLTE